MLFHVRLVLSHLRGRTLLLPCLLHAKARCCRAASLQPGRNKVLALRRLQRATVLGCLTQKVWDLANVIAPAG